MKTFNKNWKEDWKKAVNKRLEDRIEDFVFEKEYQKVIIEFSHVEPQGWQSRPIQLDYHLYGEVKLEVGDRRYRIGKVDFGTTLMHQLSLDFSKLGTDFFTKAKMEYFDFTRHNINKVIGKEYERSNPPLIDILGYQNPDCILDNESETKNRKTQLNNTAFSVDNAFSILGIPKDTSFDEAKKIYRRLCLEHHPDRNGNSTEDKMKEINHAWDVLETHYAVN